MNKKLLILIFTAMPLHGMLSRATKATRVKAPVSSTRYKTAARQVLQQRMKLHTDNKKSTALVPLATNPESPKQGLTPYQPPINNENNNRRRWFSFNSPLSSSSKSSWGALMGFLGLGWLWSSQEDDEETIKAKAEECLKDSRLTYGDPLYEFAQFIKRYKNSPIAEQLFEQMIHDDDILWNMRMKSENKVPIPLSVVPFIKRHYYTLAVNNRGAIVLVHLLNSNVQVKKELTMFAIRDMQKLCKNAQTDDFLIALLVDNQAAVEGFVEKAKNHVEELVASQVGKQLIDNNLIYYNSALAKERAMLLADSSKNFDLPAFNTCMAIIKDDTRIEDMINASYKNDDFNSLLRKMIYQKYCEHCIKADFSHTSLSLRDLVDNIGYFVSPKSVIARNIVPNKGLSHMVMEALNTEAQYSDDYYVFYHGQSSKLGFQQRLFSWLVTRKDNVMLPLIYPIPQDQFVASFDLKNLQQGTMPKYWSNDDKRPNYLYAGIGLFQHNYPLWLVSNNSSAQPTPSITTETACKDAHQEAVYKQFKNELDSLENEYKKLDKEGQLLQFRIKKNRLRDYVFNSNDNMGVLELKDGRKISDIGEVVDSFSNQPELVAPNSFAFGIAINSDLYKPDSGIKCSIINSVDPDQWKVYEQKERMLRNKIEHYLKKQESGRQKQSYGFNAHEQHA